MDVLAERREKRQLNTTQGESSPAASDRKKMNDSKGKCSNKGTEISSQDIQESSDASSNSNEQEGGDV